QQTQSTPSCKTSYRLPTSADRLVIEYRNWFDKYCQGQLPWNQVGISVPEIRNLNNNREQVLDRYKQHTQHCSSCRRALKVVQRLQAGLLIYFAISVCAVALLPDTLKVKLGLPLTVTALLSLGAYAWLKFWLSP
ncbi:MAG: Rieske 2Fe-2S domain-containing protein, partial [Nostoc sp.]